MAESVDASVSNTDGETRAGSTPAQGTSVVKSINTITAHRSGEEMKIFLRFLPYLFRHP